MNITELKELAEKATPGPWKNVDGIVLVHWDTHPYATWLADFAVGGESMEKKLANSAFCAAANPAELLELIARLEETQHDRDSWEQQASARTDDAVAAYSKLEDAQGEIRALRATEAGLIERVKELGKQLKSIVDADDDHCLSQNHIELARSLLEKKE